MKKPKNEVTKMSQAQCTDQKWTKYFLHITLSDFPIWTHFYLINLLKISIKFKGLFSHSILLQTFPRLNTRMKSQATKVISLSIVRKKKSSINKIKFKKKIVALFVSKPFQNQTMWKNILNTFMKKSKIIIVICAVLLFIILITWKGITGKEFFKPFCFAFTLGLLALPLYL